ncbi:hypothetical protein E4U23_001145, partial [Claviceps purpurea]
RSEDLETPAESEEDDHLETASAEDPPTTTEDPKRPTSENTATWPDPWPPFGTIDFSKTSSSWVLPNLRVEPPAIDLKTLQTMMLRDMAVMSQNPPPRTEIRNSPESSDGGSPRGSSLFSTDDLAELWETGVVADTTYEPRRLAVLQGERKFPPAAATKEQISNCSVDAHGILQYIQRAGVSPDSRTLNNGTHPTRSRQPDVGAPRKSRFTPALCIVKCRERPPSSLRSAVLLRLRRCLVEAQCCLAMLSSKSRLMIEDLCKWGRPIGDQNSSDKWALELVTVSRLTNKSQTFEVKYSMLYDRNVPDGELHSPSFDKSLWNLYLWNLTAV